MKTENPNILRFNDTWGGKNYGCYPINTQGQSLKEKFDNSKLWKIIKSEKHIDERNDNQCDIHRGSDFSYQQNITSKIVEIYMNKSRSGKTISWEFHCYFDGSIDF